MQLLQHSQRLLSNLSTIFHCLLSEAQELTQKGASSQLPSHVKVLVMSGNNDKSLLLFILSLALCYDVIDYEIFVLVD